MVPHIGSEASAGLAGSGGDWGVCVDAPVVVERCAVGPPPLRRFFRAEGVAKKCLRSAHGWESGVGGLMEPQIGIRGRHGANRDDVGGRGVSIEPQIGIRGRWASDAESVPALTSQ